MVFAAVIFRSEIAVLLMTHLLYMLVYSRMSLRAMIPIGLKSASICFVITFVVDTYFWQFPVWPELSGFHYNVIEGNSNYWGTSPIYYYYSHLLPKLLFNPLIALMLIPSAYLRTCNRNFLNELLMPSLLYVSVYSFQPHKEARFIIYVVIPLTAAASCSATHIWRNSSKGLLYRMGSIILAVSILGSAMLSTTMLLVSSLNYPGGHAISSLNTYINQTKVSERENIPPQISIHMDVFSCMTGVTHFLEIPGRGLKKEKLPIINGVPTFVFYDRTEDKILLSQPDWWSQFDYALMEYPKQAIGEWDLLDTVTGYSGIKVLRPGEIDSFVEYLENLLQANHVSEKYKDKGLVDTMAVKIANLTLRMMIRVLTSSRLLTRGWWVGVRLEPMIQILRRNRDNV